MARTKTQVKTAVKLESYPCSIIHKERILCDVCKKKEHTISLNRSDNGRTIGVVCGKKCQIAFVLNFDHSTLDNF